MQTNIEILEEESERFYPLFFEIIEDIALTKAMERYGARIKI